MNEEGDVDDLNVDDNFKCGVCLGPAERWISFAACMHKQCEACARTLGWLGTKDVTERFVCPYCKARGAIRYDHIFSQTAVNALSKAKHDAQQAKLKSTSDKACKPQEEEEEPDLFLRVLAQLRPLLSSDQLRSHAVHDAVRGALARGSTDAASIASRVFDLLDATAKRTDSNSRKRELAKLSEASVTPSSPLAGSFLHSARSTPPMNPLGVTQRLVVPMKAPVRDASDVLRAPPPFLRDSDSVTVRRAAKTHHSSSSSSVNGRGSASSLVGFCLVVDDEPVPLSTLDPTRAFETINAKRDDGMPVSVKWCHQHAAGRCSKGQSCAFAHRKDNNNNATATFQPSSLPSSSSLSSPL